MRYRLAAALALVAAPAGAHALDALGGELVELIQPRRPGPVWTHAGCTNLLNEYLHMGASVERAVDVVASRLECRHGATALVDGTLGPQAVRQNRSRSGGASSRPLRWRRRLQQTSWWIDYVSPDCQPGQLRFEVNVSSTSVVDICVDCMRGRFSATWNATECASCMAGRYGDDVGSSACQDCKPGTFSSQSASHECTSCEQWPSDGKRAYSTRANSTRCHICPVGGLCERDAEGLYSTLTNIDGYYVMEDSNYLMEDSNRGNELVVWCRHGHGKACLSRGRCYVDGDEQSMQGPMCGACRPGFGRNDMLTGVCTRCPSTFVSVLGVLLNIVLAFALQVVVMLIVLKTDFTNPANIHTVVLKQVINYLQLMDIVAATTEFDVPFAQIFWDSLIYLQSTVGAYSTGFSQISSWCLAEKMFPGLPLYKLAVIVGLCWLPLWALFLAVLFKVISVGQVLAGRKPLEHHLLVMILTTSLFLLMPRITNLFLMPFMCFHFDKPRLLLDTQVTCSDVLGWKMAGLAGLIIFSLGVPWSIREVLRYYKRKEMLWHPRILRVWGFWYNGFEPSAYYFETVFMFRRVVFASLAVLPGMSHEDQSTDKTVQCSSLTIAAGVFLCIHLQFQPYDNRAYFMLDRIEAASLTAIFSTALLQLFAFVTKDTLIFEDESRRMFRDNVFVIIVIMLHGRFILMAIWGTGRPFVLPRVLSQVKWSWLRCFVDSGYVEVTIDGLICHGLKEDAKHLLRVMFGELVELHVDNGGFLRYDGVKRALQAVCVDAMLAKEERVSVPRRGIWEALQNVGRVLSLSSRSSTPSSTSTPKPRQAGDFDLHVLRTYGECFTVEELHGSFLRLEKSLCASFVDPLRRISAACALVEAASMGSASMGSEGTQLSYGVMSEEDAVEAAPARSSCEDQARVVQLEAHLESLRHRRDEAAKRLKAVRLERDVVTQDPGNQVSSNTPQTFSCEVSATPSQANEINTPRSLGASEFQRKTPPFEPVTSSFQHMGSLLARIVSPNTAPQGGAQPITKVGETATWAQETAPGASTDDHRHHSHHPRQSHHHGDGHHEHHEHHLIRETLQEVDHIMKEVQELTSDADQSELQLARAQTRFQQREHAVTKAETTAQRAQDAVALLQQEGETLRQTIGAGADHPDNFLVNLRECLQPASGFEKQPALSLPQPKAVAGRRHSQGL